ncbi:MAG TPA: hypothetical protein EYG72_02685 [Candidatus Pacebacteria bacterium]|nr:hypothetical protein [Candidatus Paceibacterota bacterium]HIP34217.1 hypothetical protein [Bacteroidia bacterium]
MKIDKQMKNKKPKNLLEKLGGQALTIILVIILIVVLMSDSKLNKEKEITLSELTQKINSGLIKEIKVELGDLKIITLDDKELLSKKENESSLTETLVNLGVSTENLNKINIEVSEPDSIGYYLAK